jgi:hypothetical protein
MDYLKDTIPQRKEEPSGKQIEMEIDGVTLVADLLDNRAPRTCAMIWDVLPLEEPISHQQWSGSGLQVHGSRLREATRKAGLWPDPMDADYGENPFIYGCRGELSFHPISPGLFVTYGKSVFSGPEYGVLPSYIFGEINQDLDVLRSVGRNIAREGRTEIVIRRKE